jgi:hypothetical protein
MPKGVSGSKGKTLPKAPDYPFLTRPTDYDPNVHPKLLIKIMGIDGDSFTCFCAEVHIGRTTGYDWLKKHKEFKNAFDIANEKCEKKWRKELKSLMYRTDVNSALIKLFYANRFGMSDRVETHNTNDNNNLNAPAELGEVLDARKKYEREV